MAATTLYFFLNWSLDMGYGNKVVNLGREDMQPMRSLSVLTTEAILGQLPTIRAKYLSLKKDLCVVPPEFFIMS